MPNSTKHLLLALLISISVFPLSSHSAPIDPPCLPDNPYSDQTCTFCPADGAEFVHLKWDVQGAGDNPTCTLRCIQGDCEYKKLISRKDNQNHPISIGGDLLKPKDDIDLYPTPGLLGGSDLKAGDVYQVSCTYDTGRKDERGRAIIGTQYSPKMTITGCGNNCEIPLSVIAKNLYGGDYAKITETDFESWPKDSENKDQCGADSNGGYTFCGLGSGSGNETDIKNIMELGQCGYVSSVSENSLSSSNSKDYIEEVMKFTNDHYPAPMAIVVNGSGHAVIVTSIIKKDLNTYSLTFIDSNDSSVSRLECFLSGNGFSCRPPSTSRNPNILIADKKYVYPNLTTIEAMKRKFIDICTKNGSLKMCIERKGQMSSWLEGNYIDIKNFTGSLPGTGVGICAGWTEFLLRVAYLGDFVGKDYHPGDKIGTVCNADLTPKTSKSTLGIFSQQLALLQQIFMPFRLWPN